uniref:Uncharacterized protein n=1 Tax=Arundo donax TaxID=35708 RepID=A0A0A9CW86_ARUDO
MLCVLVTADNEDLTQELTSPAGLSWSSGQIWLIVDLECLAKLIKIRMASFFWD